MPSSSRNKAEIKVIDDILLLGGIQSNGHKLLENVTEESSIVELAPITEALVLSFNSIGKIENMNGFDNLTKLCLDNNQIEKIQGLSHLKKLRWLDLSFNKIRKIEGLDSMEDLVDLSLYSNKITEVSGLSTCLNLQCGACLGLVGGETPAGFI